MKYGKLKIAVDVDLTVVDSLTPWLDWYALCTDEELQFPEGVYDLVPHMQEKIVDPMEFWRDPNLYDELKPIEGSMDALRILSNMGHDIFFVTKCEPEHSHSKKQFLDKYFPFHKGMIDTDQKYLVRYNILIDDNVQYLSKAIENNKENEHFLFRTVANKGIEPENCKVVDSWCDILEKVSETRANYERVKALA